jgi:hypothetical protein
MSEARISAPLSVPDFLHPDGQARLELKPPGPVTGFVDGAWWPRSNDLAREARPLLAAIAPLRGATLRLNYDLAAWTNTAHSIMAAGTRVHLDGFRGRPPDRILLTDKTNRSVTLLVIPPDTDDRSATESMRRASTAGNQEDPDSLLAPAALGHSDRPDQSGSDVAEREWETDGGTSAEPTAAHPSNSEKDQT